MEMRGAATQRCLHGRWVYEGKRARVRVKDSVHSFISCLLLFMESENHQKVDCVFLCFY